MIFIILIRNLKNLLKDILKKIIKWEIYKDQFQFSEDKTKTPAFHKLISRHNSKYTKNFNIKAIV